MKPIEKLDKEFSRYIRLKHANDNGKCKCITCGRTMHWKEIDAGHFIDRRHISTRFHEKNVHPQCIGCNRMNNGNIEKYEVKIISLYGEKTLNELIALKYTAMKLSKAEVLELANEYREKSKLIAKNKGICL